MKKTGRVPSLALRSVVRRRDCPLWMRVHDGGIHGFCPCGPRLEKNVRPKTAHVFLECRGSPVQGLLASSPIGTVLDPSG